MTKLTKAQARKRLIEARTKISKVYTEGMHGDGLFMTWKDYEKVMSTLTKTIKKLGN